MNAHIFETAGYESDITIVDIDVASEEEAQLYGSGLSRFFRRSLVKGPYRGVFVIAVMTFSGPELPVGTEITFAGTTRRWKVIAKNKAAYPIPFNPEEYEEDKAKIKVKLSEWAVKSGVVFD
jgi:hypothetical protein